MTSASDLSPPLKILLLEDQPADAELLDIVLAEDPKFQYQLTMSERVQQAIQLLQSQVFDVVLTDLSLPDASDMEAIAYLRQAAPDLPVVVLTGVDDPQVGLSALREGAQDYLVKGQLSHPLLVRTIRYAIERYRNQQTMQQQAAAINAQKHNLELLRLIEFSLDQINDSVFLTRSDARFFYVNQAACRTLGYSREELLQLTVHDLDPNYPPDNWEQHWQYLRQQGSFLEESVNRHRDGYEFPVEISTTMVEFGGQEFKCTVVRDIRDRKRVEEQLRNSLEEKELLFREVHHRVKNNLQIISSIFSLQRQYIDDPRVLSVLAESRDRIYSMALIHEQLYRSSLLTRIDLKDYIHNLSQSLLKSYNINPDRIQIHLNIADVSLDVDTAIPCGLIINELITNALKHAFPAKAIGHIQIDFLPIDDCTICLTVRDTGIGLPESFDSQHTNSLGLRLVRALTRQLCGDMNAYNDNGTVFQLTFALQHYDGSQ
jgi:PAS domain S-box-containing protein